MKWIGLGVAVLLVAGLGVIWFTEGLFPEVSPERVQMEPSAQQDADDASEADGALEGQGTFAELARRGESLTCTFSYTDAEENATTEGEVFIDGERMRGTFETAMQGDMHTMRMIHDSGQAWLWGESPQGDMAYTYTVTMDDGPGAQADDAAPEQDPLASDQEVEYSCAPWRVDESAFTPPADVEFQSMGAQMEAMMGAQAESGADMQAQQCAACDSLSDEARAQCRAALSCPE